MNSYNCTGRLTTDPARRDTTKGVVAEFRLAVDGRPNRVWIDVEAWGHAAGTVATYLTARRHVADHRTPRPERVPRPPQWPQADPLLRHRRADRVPRRAHVRPRRT